MFNLLFNKNQGITLIELLIAIAILMIIVVVSIISFNSANKMSELRIATDEFADTIRDLQTIALSNIKEVENPDGYETYPYELGYQYTFNIDSNIISYDEIFSTSPEINVGQYIYYNLNDKTLLENHNIVTIETDDGEGNTVSYDSYNLAYLFPEAKIIFYSQEIISPDTINNLIIYIKHDEINDWRGKVTINQYSGRITSEVIEYP